jgi:hypothetical protein
MEKNFPFTYQKTKAYLSIFDKVYFKEKLTSVERLRLGTILLEYLWGKNRKLLTSNPVLNRLKSLRSVFASKPHSGDAVSKSYQRWGFKSPPGIYFVQPLCAHYAGAAFIHVVRDGRDISLSTNRKPLLYSRIFGGHEADTTVAAYYNWCAVNTFAHRFCTEHLAPQQYLTVKYEDVCTDTHASVDKILDFVGMGSSKGIEEIYSIPKNSASIGRWKERQEVFHDLDVSALQLLGYE